MVCQVVSCCLNSPYSNPRCLLLKASLLLSLSHPKCCFSLPKQHSVNPLICHAGCIMTGCQPICSCYNFFPCNILRLIVSPCPASGETLPLPSNQLHVASLVTHYPALVFPPFPPLCFSLTLAYLPEGSLFPWNCFYSLFSRVSKLRRRVFLNYEISKELKKN